MMKLLVLPWVFFCVGIWGIKHRNGTIVDRISAGHTTDIRKFPYQVMVLCRSGLEVEICGGVLLSKTKIATAAHCVVECDKEHLEVLAGVHEPDLEHKHKVRSIHAHPQYTERKFSYDIAVVCLEYTLKECDRIKHINVAKKEVKGGTKAIVTGWGRTEDKPLSKRLRYAEVTVSDRDECADENSLFDETQICTDSDGTGPCKGDSGGPLVANGELIGIVSYGSEKCTASYVRMYANAVHFKEFLDSHKC